MADDVTQRDLVWAAILEQSGRFETSDLYDDLPDSNYERPSHETIKRVLRAATRLGILNHKPKSPTYTIQNEYDPRHRAEYRDFLIREGLTTKTELQLVGTRRRESERGQIELEPEEARELGEKLIELADGAEAQYSAQ